MMQTVKSPSATEAYTVPSVSRHSDIVEAIESLTNRKIAEVQLDSHNNIQRIIDFVNNTKYDDDSHRLAVSIACDRKIAEIVKEEARAIQAIRNERDAILCAFVLWEKQNPEPLGFDDPQLLL